jgi:hypothetical protein
VEETAALYVPCIGTDTIKENNDAYQLPQTYAPQCGGKPRRGGTCNDRRRRR